MENVYNRAGILKAIYDELEDVCKDRFINDRPNTTTKQLKEFLVIAIMGSLHNNFAYGEATARIDIFRKNKANGIEDTIGLQRLIDKTLTKFPISNKLFSATTPNIFAGGDDTLGFHWLSIRFDITTK